MYSQTPPPMCGSMSTARCTAHRSIVRRMCGRMLRGRSASAARSNTRICAFSDRASSLPLSPAPHEAHQEYE